MNTEPVAWMPAFGFERFYEVSNQGDVRRIGSNKCLAKNLMGAGYVKADLWADNKRTQTSVHRLVALTFLPPSHDGMEVNHKDGNKTNNHVSNLEWVTKSQNEKHSREELGNLCKPVKAICLKTGEVRIYPSQTATARDGFEPKCVSDICRKEDRYTHKGWAFEYYTHPVEEHFEDEPQAEELHEIMQSNTHPAELTDEEIIEIGLLTTDPRFSHIESPLLLEFARAILRKAQNG